MAFLCTRVQAPNVDDYKKLAKVMQYLCGMRHLTLTIEPDGDNNLNWWVDSSYDVHPDMRSHSAIIMTLGKGATYTSSTKEKINTKSSMEAELVAIDYSMAQVLWTRHFLTSQGLCVMTTTIYQDNKSTILLAENGKTSSNRRTKHLDGRYFFMTDKIKKGEVKEAFCPMHNMLADLFTKPLQGRIFIHMRDKILNLPAIENHRHSQECVGNQEKIEKMDGSKRNRSDPMMSHWKPMTMTEVGPAHHALAHNF